MSNHELAKRYKEKSKLIGRDILEIEYLEDDRVRLVDVKDKENSGKLVIPSFITEIGLIRGVKVGPLKDCMYTDVYVDNKNGRLMRTDYLCSGMRTDKLKLEFSYPEYIVSMDGLFHLDAMLKELDLSKLKTSNVEIMKDMFSGCERLEYIDISNLDMSRVIDISNIFSWCTSLREIDMSKNETSRIENMHGMFSGCMGLIKVNINGIDSSRVVDMSDMFSFCNKLRELDLSSLDTSNVVNMSNMFRDCNMLMKLNISGWDTSKVEDISKIFMGCKNLKMLDLSNLDISNVRKMENIFKDTNIEVKGMERINERYKYLEELELKQIYEWINKRCDWLRDERYGLK